MNNEDCNKIVGPKARCLKSDEVEVWELLPLQVY